MALRRIPSPRKETELPMRHFSIDLEGYIQRSEQQKAHATEMIQRVKEMCVRAAEMRKGPRLAVL